MLNIVKRAENYSCDPLSTHSFIIFRQKYDEFAAINFYYCACARATATHAPQAIINS